MSLSHKPCEVIAKYLISGNFGTTPASNGNWPIFTNNTAPEPNNLLCVYDTTGLVPSQTLITGLVIEYYGIQLFCRAETDWLSFSKLQACALYCDVASLVSIVLDSSTYKLQGLKREGTINSFGPQSSDNNLWVHTVNYLITLTKVS